LQATAALSLASATTETSESQEELLLSVGFGSKALLVSKERKKEQRHHHEKRENARAQARHQAGKHWSQLTVGEPQRLARSHPNSLVKIRVPAIHPANQNRPSNWPSHETN
jgi:hypothetical protein